MSADRHLLDAVRDAVPYGEPMGSQEIVRELAERGDAFAVIAPDSVEERELDGETVTVVRGGARKALSARALDERLGKRMSGFRRDLDGRWEKLDHEDTAERMLRGDTRC